MFKDYYATLVISQTATIAEIKLAYRKQALKWHPDKNQGTDTTEKMKEINEAKLILMDEEAIGRYDIEYSRFKKHQEESQKKQYEQKPKEEETNYQEEYSRKEKDNKQERYSQYEFNDEILKKWMNNAKKQASKNISDMITEFRDSSIIGFGIFFKQAFAAILGAAIIWFIIYIIFTIKS